VFWHLVMDKISAPGGKIKISAPYISNKISAPGGTLKIAA